MIATYECYVDKYKLTYDELPVAEPNQQVNQKLDVAKLEKVGFTPSELDYQPIKLKTDGDFWVDRQGGVFFR